MTPPSVDSSSHTSGRSAPPSAVSAGGKPTKPTRLSTSGETKPLQTFHKSQETSAEAIETGLRDAGISLRTEEETAELDLTSVQVFSPVRSICGTASNTHHHHTISQQYHPAPI
jgi:hypothetical protein